MKPIFLTFLLVLNISDTNASDNPYEYFSTQQNFTYNSKITWKVVDDVQKTCNDIHVKNTGKSITKRVLACASWSKNIIFKDECTIITSKNTTMWTVGHEIRHCFQGDFHKNDK